MSLSEAKASDLLNEMTLEEKLALTIGRDFWSTNSVERLGLESIALTDGPHGVRKSPQGGELGIGNSIPATCFPTAAALAASWDIELAGEIGRALAEECIELDVQVLLGPGVNIKRTPLGGRSFEYFSEDPVLAGEMGAAWVAGLQSLGVGASLKHYACNNQEYERFTINVDVDERTLREIYLTAFERVVKKTRPWTVMAAYNKVNGVYASEHPRLLTEILKEEWGFEGLVVSDWGAVNDKAHALTAGLDLEMPGPVANQGQKLVQFVKEGKLAEEAIDAAARRVINMIRRGMAGRQAGFKFDRASHHNLARRAAAESIVLLKNEGDILPLDPQGLGQIAVIGRFAAQPRYQGAGSSFIVPTMLDSTLTELENWLDGKEKIAYAEGYSDTGQPEEALLAEAVELARNSSVALIFAGLPDSFESEGFDRQDIFMPEGHNRLIEEVCRVQPNTVVILHNGSVVAMPWVAGPKAIIEAGLGGQGVGRAIVDVLSGKVNPCGKLAETFPVRLQDTPAYTNYPGDNGTVLYGEGIFVGYRYYEKKQIQPLFPFGHGLSYTTFEYSNLKTNAGVFKTGQTLDVTLTVRNSGSRAGKEVVQVYVRALNSAFSRPDKELKAFAKVELGPGEAKEVHLSLEERDFMIYDTERQGWYLEGGSYEVVAGASSADERLKAPITVEEDPGAARRVFTRMTQVKHFLQHPVGRARLMEAIGGTGGSALISGESEIFTSIPIIKIATFAGLPEEKVDALIAELNSQD